MKIEYNEGRFFVSPIIGCTGKCSYCYLSENGIKDGIRFNKIGINSIIQTIMESSNFIQGKNGSIISIGAWGDIFAGGNNTIIEFSIGWIKKLLSIGNPVQIMSKYAIAECYIDEICKEIKYINQLLYSITITTFNNWSKFEEYTSSPLERIKTLGEFEKRNVPTNIMIKPFIPGITNNEIELYKHYLHKYKVNYCVVGELYINESIMSNLMTKDIDLKNKLNTKQKLILDCTGDQEMDTHLSNDIGHFILKLRECGINIFRKSSCVNSNILQTPNISEYYKCDPNGFCQKCGNCNKRVTLS